ncbi:hypothetical protein [Endozoicomonas sp. Mp262]|uniref:hypothetical protein n=1 Tax=Endozoicomonas sp. Mp262 TaxID=2919499 RepID=UPI0021D817FE
MPATYEAKTDEQGNLCLPPNIKLPEGCRILVTVLDELPKLQQINDEALLSEKALAEDWDKPEEDEAWSTLGKE